MKRDTIRLIRLHWFKIVISCALLFSLFTHFYNFSERWGLGNDDSRDVAISQEALKRGELPLIGSFSSAGPFTFGPIFYWTIMGSLFLSPQAYLAPWIFTGLVGVGIVGVFSLIGYRLGGRIFSLLLTFLAATSPQLITRSLSLGQHTYVILFAALTVLFFIFYIQKSQKHVAFLFGLSLGIAINYHYQAVNLLILFPLILFVGKITFKSRIMMLLTALGGFVLALSPLLIWDSQQSFANLRNLFDYLLVGQHRLYVPNSWRLYLFEYLPSMWAFIVGGEKTIGAVLYLSFGIIFGLGILIKKIKKEILYLAAPFFILLLVNKFYKGERSEGYLLYFVPFILIFTSYIFYFVINQLTQKSKKIQLFRVIAILLFVLLVGFNGSLIPKILSYKSPVSSVESAIDALVEKYPDKKFVVYDYEGSMTTNSQPLAFLLSQRDLTAKDGLPIGVICYIKCGDVQGEVGQFSSVAIVDMNSGNNLKREWMKVNPEDMYDSLIGWSHRHELRSNFNFFDYAKSRILE